MSTELKLDPGPQPRRRPKLSCCSCCLWTVLVVVGLTAIWAVYYGTQLAVRLVRKGPLFEHYQDLSVPYKPGEVIEPLVGSEQTFDIVATVWMRRDADEGAPTTELVENTSTSALVEDVLYSDTVFRGLHLKDKNVKTAVNLSIPTDIFKKTELWNYDLRASFVLIPTPPSSLDFAVNYSSWIPTSMYFPPMRPVTEFKRSLADEIIDSYGVVVPLLDFHHLASACGTSSSGDASPNDYVDEEDDGNLDMIIPTAPETVKSEYTSTKGKSAMSAHPYIMTRTHIQVLDVTAVFNRAAYDKMHKQLASTSCGQGNNADEVSWKNCQRTYLLNGNTETRIKLRTPDANTGKNTTRWAYSPYMVSSEVASGPLDMVPVPVSRGPSCKDDADILSESRMNFTWNIALSGRTPSKWLGGSVVKTILTPSSRNITSNTTEFDIHSSQAKFAYINGVVGYSYEDKGYPRLLYAASTLTSILGGVSSILSFLYWYSCSSTAGISINGTALRITGMSFGYIRTLTLPSQDKNQKPFNWLGIIIFTLIVSSTVVPMARAITRAEVKWAPGAWLPSISISQATHAERASKRVDSRVSKRAILIAYIAVAAVAFACRRFDIKLLATEGIRRPAEPLSRGLQLATLIVDLVCGPCMLIGNALQAIINMRHKAFAGYYKLGIWTTFIFTASQLITKLPGLWAFSTLEKSLSLHDCVSTIVFGIMSWQAVIYPSASHALKDKDME